MRKLFVLAVLVLAACTDKSSTRSFGGTTTMTLPKGQKLITVTWKNADFWYLSRPMREGEVPETYEFVESSNWGMVEGKVIIREQR